MPVGDSVWEHWCCPRRCVCSPDAANALREGPRWGDLRAAYREARGSSYEILWPQTLQKFSVK